MESWWIFNLILTALTVIISLYFQNKGKSVFSVLLLVLSAFLLRLVIIDLDPFLHPWDERFHALVAKNMIETPFVPVLRENPLLPYDYKDWANNHVWLHKQPLFLWQMALSMNIFGEAIFTARIPSAIEGAIMVLFIYKIGCNLKNAQTGYYGALLWAFSYYSFLLASGSQVNDHNDMAFAFYVTGSMWAFSEYVLHPGWKWATLTGIFAGLAVLVKWLVGLLVFAGWGIAILTSLQWRKTLNSYWHWLLALGTSIIIFLPWQVYTFSRFPKIAQHELALNRKHIFQVVEGHSGSWDFYIGNLDLYMGQNVWLLLILGFIALFMVPYPKPLVWAFITNVVITFGFFSFIPSKLPSYVFFIVPLLLVITGAGLAFVETQLQSKFPMLPNLRPFFIILAFLLAILSMRPADLYQYYKKTGAEPTSIRNRFVHNKKVFKKLDSLTEKGSLIMGAKRWSHINAMFHTNRNVVNGIPDKKSLKNLKKKNIPLATFANAPDSIRKDPEIKALPFHIR